jgi:lysophospholipase L1-like esterase
MRIISFVLMLFVSAASGLAQRYAEDVARFDKTVLSEGSTLMIGSSSFTMWKDTKLYFPKEKIINRAFGGSTLKDLLYYKKEIIDPYKPSRIWIYCGENDFAEDPQMSPEKVFLRFDSLYNYIREIHPLVQIFYVGMKPSPSRWRLKDKYIIANALIRERLAKDKRNVFINVWRPMIGKDGLPDKSLFVEDQLHMNAKGYEIWARLINQKLQFVTDK